MRILLLSDISWRKTNLASIEKEILRIDPSLVLLAGDLVDNDKSIDGRTEAWSSLYEFVDFLNENKMQTFFIRGNWDRAPYDSLVAKTHRLPYVDEIAGRIAEFDGVNVLGIPYSFTNRLGTAKRLGELFPAPVDIVLAHAELARRIWLFELKTRFVVTGHFDSQLCQIRDKAFVSLGGFPSSYVIIDYEKTVQTVTYFERDFLEQRDVFGRAVFVQEGETRASRARLVDGRLAWDTEAPASLSASGKHREYAALVESLISAKEHLDAGVRRRDEVVAELQNRGVPKKHIREYIGGIA